jgi:hypothetical protein
MRHAISYKTVAYREGAATRVTSRRLANATRALRREREKRPLFAAQLAQEQETPEARILAIATAAIEQEQRFRDLAARHWREARARLAAMPDEKRAQLLALWETSFCPPDASYFADYTRNADKILARRARRG